MFDDGSLPTFEAFVEDWRQQEQRGRRSWAVMKDGEIGGCLISTQLSPVAADLHLIFKKSFWGRATTRTALRLVCEEVFLAGVDRIESTAPADSRALLALTKGIGATSEPVGQNSRRGKPLNMMALVLNRDAFLKNAEAR